MFELILQLHAHKKGTGSSHNGRDSNSQRLGTKAHESQLVTAGSIIVRQRYAMVEGRVKFERKGRDKRQISVYPVEEAM